jgi:hypothetical protein
MLSAPSPTAAAEDCMITIVRVAKRNVLIFKDARLRALQESPDAFSSTYASETQLTENDWLTRAEKLNGEVGIGFLALGRK